MLTEAKLTVVRDRLMRTLQAIHFIDHPTLQGAKQWGTVIPDRDVSECIGIAHEVANRVITFNVKYLRICHNICFADWYNAPDRDAYIEVNFKDYDGREPWWKYLAYPTHS